MVGRIHSFQSLGTVDGPGVRCVVFMQGCPLRCICCHNPDTWDFEGGEEMTVDTLVAKILRFKNYFGETGGVTVSGGEPLCQAAFVTELFKKLHEAGIHTALDTSGCVWNADVENLLSVTDLVLLDHKYADSDCYERFTKGSLQKTETFLDALQARNVDTWLRRVIIPEKSDSEESVRQLATVAKAHSCVKKVELLPFRSLCKEKYDQLGIPFLLADTASPSSETMERLCALL